MRIIDSTRGLNEKLRLSFTYMTLFRVYKWARIVLVVERGVSPAERLKKLTDYSQPMSDGRRALVLRLNQTVSTRKYLRDWKQINLPCQRY